MLVASSERTPKRNVEPRPGPKCRNGYRLSPILVPLFTLTATALYSSDEAHAKTWRIDAVAWSENKVEAFAGLHNEGQAHSCRL